MNADPQSQHMTALAKANAVRLRIAKAKKRVHSGEIAPRDIINEPDLQDARLMEVLCSQRRWGVTRSRKFLTRVGSYRPSGSFETLRLRELTVRERRALTAELVSAEPTPKSQGE